jgi:transmembrane sensor
VTVPPLEPRPPPGPSHRALEQAAQWFAALCSGEATAADRSRWEAWLAESVEHGEAWGYVENISRRFGPIKSSPARHTAISAYQQASGARLRRRQALLGIASLAGSSLFGWMAWRHTPLPGMTQAWMADHRTGTGEVREVTLADGTRVWLNAVSAFNQDYRSDLRRLHLVRGEILIDTAADPLRRPFYVETAQGRLQALGTRFTMRLDDDAQICLAVYEGAVEVRTGAGVTTVVPVGRQVRFTSSSLGPPGPADPAREAWTRGMLVARNIPLSGVVRELRRYHHGHLGLAPEVADLPVFGGYPVHDPDQTLAMLEAVLPIRVRRPLPWWVSIEPGDGDAGSAR